MKPKTLTLQTLAECSIMVALATVLSVFKLFEMPYGGSITFASLLPIVIVAYRHGTKVGIGSALVASVLQMLLGLKNFSYFTSVESFIALALFDYLIAFTVFGLAGILRSKLGSQTTELALGTLIACVLRYICHTISGATVWAGLSIPTEAALIYSISYNATYMIPDTIILALTAVYVCSALELSGRIPKRRRSEKLDTVSAYLALGAGLSLLIGLIIDTVLVFGKLQNPETGDFDITGITSVDPVAITVTTLVALAVSLVLIVIIKKRSKAN